MASKESLLSLYFMGMCLENLHDLLLLNIALHQARVACYTLTTINFHNPQLGEWF